MCDSLIEEGLPVGLMTHEMMGEAGLTYKVVSLMRYGVEESLPIRIGFIC